MKPMIPLFCFYHYEKMNGISYQKSLTMVIDSEIGKRLCVSGGDPEIAESPSEPQWSPKGTNFFFMIYILQLAAQAFFV